MSKMSKKTNLFRGITVIFLIIVEQRKFVIIVLIRVYIQYFWHIRPDLSQPRGASMIHDPTHGQQLHNSQCVYILALHTIHALVHTM